jgi:hypothetical protein
MNTHIILLLHRPTDRKSAITVFRRTEILWLCMTVKFNKNKIKVDT